MTDSILTFRGVSKTYRHGLVERQPGGATPPLRARELAYRLHVTDVETRGAAQRLAESDARYRVAGLNLGSCLRGLQRERPDHHQKRTPHECASAGVRAGAATPRRARTRSCSRSTIRYATGTRYSVSTVEKITPPTIA